MGTDVYQPCPCGSGKKLKFCCIDIAADMEKVATLQEKNRFPQALQKLEKLGERKGLGIESETWIALTRATIELSMGEPAAARSTLEQLLEKTPDHLLAVALKATAMFAEQGFEDSKADVHRAFQKCALAYPELISSLAMGIAQEMHLRGCHMAAREHLALAIRTAREADRQEVFMHLLQFEANGEVPYPLRSVHQVREVEGEKAEEAQKATRRAGLGMWSEAAKRFAKLREHDPENATLLMNLGYCHAFDGNEEEAATALHEAASKTDDIAEAIEWETVAQLLDLSGGEHTPIMSVPFKAEGVSQLLSRLDDASARVVRTELPPDEEFEGSVRPSGFYELLAFEPADVAPAELTREQVPNVLGRVTIYPHGAGKDDHNVYVAGPKGEMLEEAKKLFQEAAGDLVQTVPETDEGFEVDDGVPTELEALSWRWYLPPKMPNTRRMALELEQWNEAIFENWLSQPLSALGGRTPSEAAKLDELRVPLLAAVLVVDCYCDRNRHHLDLDRLTRELNLTWPDPLTVDEDASLQSYSILKLHRVSLPDLSDRQLQTVLNRALLTQHRRFLKKTLLEVFERPELQQDLDPEKLYLSMVELAREQGHSEEALQWIGKAQEWARGTEDVFQNLFKMEMRELAIRLDDPTDPELVKLAHRIWNQYGPKLPQVREHIAQLLTMFDLPLPEEGLVTPTVGGETSGGVWTPGSQPGGNQPTQKLWVPGED